MPRIDDQLLRCVFYVYISREDALQGQPDSATGFFFGVACGFNKNFSYTYAVTNKHVIQHPDMKKPVLRINTRAGKFDIIETKSEQWKPHPLGNDLAICMLGLNRDIHDFAVFGTDFLLTKEFMEEKNVGAGDDVFMIGNFQTRGGKTKNLPTVRFGNIAQMPDEPMKNLHTSMDEESFIVEMRSASGYSGSPVILSIPATSSRFDNKIEINPETGRPKLETLDYYKLLGIDWGHIRTKERLYDKDGNMLPERESIWINSSMAGVVPSWKLLEMLYDPEEIEMRQQMEEKIKKEMNLSEIVVDSGNEEAEEPNK